jgi:hypothetical protein
MPHSIRNFVPSGVSASQREQRIDGPSGTVVRAVGGAYGQNLRHLSLIRANRLVCQSSRPTQCQANSMRRLLMLERMRRADR